MSDPNRRTGRPDEGLGDEEFEQERDRGREQQFPPERKQGQPGTPPSRERPGQRPDEGTEDDQDDEL